MLRGFLVLLVCQCLGEAFKALTDIALPGPVIGMLLLLAVLVIRGGVPEWLGQTSSKVISYLSLMFLPPAVGLFFLGPDFADQWPAVIAAIVLGTLLTLLVSAALMQWLVNRRESENSSS